ncbi:MAG: threonine--tRNA ligase [Spirochaetales bacterium]|jgi:threonyl-tRNA synthetase|nr:threonine--tRNA ligase [Spirochaetales bacterium]
MPNLHNESSVDLAVLRHSTAHVMAEAVTQIFPQAKVAIGPAIEDGFYYDFDLPRPLKPEDLEEISARMGQIIARKSPFTRRVVSRQEALSLFADQPYKLEILGELPEDGEITVYNQGGFTDLCRGPHLSDTAQINPGAFKLLKIAGAYWRGDEKRPMLQRIYGAAFERPEDLQRHLDYLEEMEKRDHRRLGTQLDLFSLHEEAGPGLVYWHPRGARIRGAIENFWREEHYKNGYEMVYTPHIGKSWLWETSGHLDFYAENMYPPMEMDKTRYYPKPMNCPFHIMIYNNSKHSYRDLPCRWAELGTVYRYEKSGVLHGLFRVRGFTQDDAHIICTPAQMRDEIFRVLRFSLYMLRSFGFTDIAAYLSTRPEKSVGEDEKWETAQEILRAALEEENLPYEVDEGGGAFYGPKIDLKIRDAMGRFWQLSTVQFDFNEPELFSMTFVDQDGQEKRPFMVHRALLGSLERFFGILIEHYGGAFPVWLAPVQAAIIPVAPAFTDYAREVEKQFQEAGIRALLDDSDQRMNAKIRNAQEQKIPYMLVLGDRERGSRTVSLRLRTGEKTPGFSLEEGIDYIRRKSAAKENL